MARLVLIGGLTTPMELLEPVGEAAVSVGFADDVDIFTLTQGLRDPDMLGRALEGSIAACHSAGARALRLALNPHKKPKRVEAVSGVEPVSLRHLPGRMHRKVQQARASGDDRAVLSSVVNHNLKEGTRHPLRTTGQILGFRNFSTLESLARYGEMGVRVGAVVMTDDVIMPHDPLANLWEIDVLELPGTHDEFLIHPQEVMQAIAKR